MPNRKALILKLLLTESEENETLIIEKQLELYNYDFSSFKIENNDQLKDSLESGEKFDIIYLSAHGDENGFANEAGDYECSWKNFGELLYNSSCLDEDNILLLSCCQGGLNKVAYDMFYICPEIGYLCGPRLSLNSGEMLAGFSVFLFNCAYLGLDPTVSAEKVLKATDMRFKCFDRLDTITETAFLVHTEVLEIIPVDLNQDGVKEGIIVNQKPRVKPIVYTEEDSEQQIEDSN
ncbi:hypothetical protein [Flagellimonas halotolerans]|uniref:CHAT domain-containing protein n=1 Tax=Flagellimonas halotolerans TaxID=3112164 RepID=A0ABU6IMT9_9FLAO|nr:MULTISPECIES: hypothetical protein [unclassified Allomuricauda]MEC3964549.1 hypothetical protein [Muricauda sp. SYSU M86414]MEC4264418.1 hypothetical protein [Muricauda sp. SYSU M84420]